MRTALPGRLLVAALTVLLVVTATFVALHLVPGDPVRLFLGPAADPATVAATRHALGLDRPLPAQYLEWLGRFASGRWGTSIAQQRPVAAVLGDALGPTLLLVGASLLLTYVGGILVGAWQAARRASRADAAVTAATTVLYALPSYVVALGLVAVFAYGTALWRWPAALRFPAFGAAGLGADLLGPAARLADRVRHLVLPVATLALVGVAGTARFVRGAMVDALRPTSLPQNVILAQSDLVTAQKSLSDLLTSDTSRANAWIALRDAQDAFKKANDYRNTLNGKVELPHIGFGEGHLVIAADPVANPTANCWTSAPSVLRLPPYPHPLVAADGGAPTVTAAP